MDTNVRRQANKSHSVFCRHESQDAMSVFVEAVRINVREWTVQDIHQRVVTHEQFLLFDIREENEFARGHLPGAKSLGKGIIERDIESIVPDFDREIVLYCGRGFRSALAADNLKKLGYTNVISMDGGFRGWKEASFPIEVTH
jgi:rhodanese-related sulfurtransferase